MVMHSTPPTYPNIHEINTSDMRTPTLHEFLGNKSSVNYTMEEIIRIKSFKNINLNEELSIILTLDEDNSYIAKTEKMPIYSYGNTKQEAISNMEEELEFLHQDFINDPISSFSDEWLSYRKFFLGIINAK